MPISHPEGKHEDGTLTAPASEQTDAPNVTRDGDKRFLELSKAAIQSSHEYYTQNNRSQWTNANRAFQNQHIERTKYASSKYRNRSKLFRPKTRNAVRKNLASTALALFSTEDVVSVSTENSYDRASAATARFVHEALNVRLDRTNPWAGPNWFLTVLGARQDTQIHGVCFSKQYWEYEEVEFEYEQEVLVPAVNEMGIPLINEDGLPELQSEIEYTTEAEVMRDRIMVELCPPEHAIVDTTSSWADPVQEGVYFGMKWPIRLDVLETQVKSKARQNKMGGGKWRGDFSESLLKQGNETRESSEQRLARQNGGPDRYDALYADRDGKVVWVYEMFYRIDGVDYQWWQVGEHLMLSDPMETIEAYPEQDGMRPYARGIGELEAHKVYPTSPVTSWQPLQFEINDTTNLRLDALKQSISPITMVRRGRKVDLKQVQNRGPDAVMMVDDMDDVHIDRAPVPPSISESMNHLLTEFDESAGVFSQGSVQTNRQLNETVGGMRMLSGSANDQTSFDLRVFVETWVEPALRQCVNLIKHYESDERVMRIAGENAGLFERIELPGEENALDQPSEADQFMRTKMADVMERMDREHINVKVDVGIGSMDSQQKFERLGAIMQATMNEMMVPLMQQEGMMPDVKAILQEIWGLGGYKDASRFFKQMPKQKEEGPPPEIQEKMIDHKHQMEQDEAKYQADMAANDQQIQADLELQARDHEFEAGQAAVNRMQDERRAMESNVKDLFPPVRQEA